MGLSKAPVCGPSRSSCPEPIGEARWGLSPSALRHRGIAPMDSISSGLSFALVDGQPVFMDERNDSYFLLDREQEEQFLDMLSQSAKRACSTLQLCNAPGLGAEFQTLAATQCLAGVRSLLDDPRARRRARLIDIVKLWRILRQVRRWVKRRPIQSILDQFRASEPHGGAALPAHQLVDQALRFAAARKAVPVAPNCLADSLAMLVWLKGAGSGATLVFAVKLDPFAAHCWVQAGTLLLNDGVDDTARFQPVRIITCSPATR